MARTRDEHRATPEPVPASVPAPANAPVPVATVGSRDRPPRWRPPLLVAAAVTTFWAALVSYLVTAGLVALAVIPLGARLGLDGLVRAGATAWLLAGGVPIGLGDRRLTLIPLTITVIALWRVMRAGASAARAIDASDSDPWYRLPALAAAIGLCYGLLGATVAAATSAATVRVPAGRTALTFALSGAVAAAVGAARHTGRLSRIGRRLPPVVRDGGRTGLIAALLTVALAATTAGVAVAVAGHRISGVYAAYHTGVAGQAGLTLLCLAYLPDLAIWAAAYLIGPGFALGAGTTVSGAQVSLGAVPAVPVLAALPGGPAGRMAAVLAAIPLLAAMAAGVAMVRRHRRVGRRSALVLRWPVLVAASVVASVIGGLALGFAGWFAGGALGSRYLAVTGPDPIRLGTSAALVIGIGVLAGAAVQNLLGGLGRRPPAQ